MNNSMSRYLLLSALLSVSLITPLYSSEDASLQSLKVSELSLIASVYGPIMIIGSPIILSEQMAEIDDTAKEQALTSFDVLDYEGNPAKIYLPREAKEKVNLKPTDRVRLETDDKGGAILYQNNVAKHYFIHEKDAHLNQQKKL